MKTKPIASAILCFIMVFALLPTTALATNHYDSWEDAIADPDLAAGDTITIGGTNYSYSDQEPDYGYDMTPPPSVKTVFKAGDGMVLWTPAEGSDPDTLKLIDALIELEEFVVTAFDLPNDVPVKIVLEGENAIIQTKLNFIAFVCESPSPDSKLTLTGTGTISADTGDKFIKAGDVILDGGTRKGTIDANSLKLNNVTVPENGTLNLEAVDTLTATGTVNNGTLVLTQFGEGADDNIAAIKALDLTGDGLVKVIGNAETDPPIHDVYYTNDGTLVPSRSDPLYFHRSPVDGNWKKNATLEIDGYEFSGNETDGYELKLGNLFMPAIYADGGGAITLPGDGPVNVILTRGTTAVITSAGPSPAMMFIKTTDTAYPCTISGSGNLELTASSFSSLDTKNPLTIEGGNITIKNDVSRGIDASSTSLTISGGNLSITAGEVAIKAGSLKLKDMIIKSPKGAKFDADNNNIYMDGEPVASLTLKEAADDDDDYEYSPLRETVYNDPIHPNATIWLAGKRVDSSDLLITERSPSGSAYQALLSLANSSDVFATYNIYLRSGMKSTGSAMWLTFDLTDEYMMQRFTLVHQKSDGTYEYFYDAADLNGQLDFGPLYELSPFMLVKGTLRPGQTVSVVDIPATGESAQPALYLSVVLMIAAASLAVTAHCRRRRVNGKQKA